MTINNKKQEVKGERSEVVPAVYNVKDNFLNKKNTIYREIKTTVTDKKHYDAYELIDYIKNNTTGYEGIFGQVKPYFDFDISYKTKREQKNNEYEDVKKAVDGVCEFLSCRQEDCIVLTANGKKSTRKWVNSIHIIVNNDILYKDGKALKTDIEAHQWDDKITPDLQPYSTTGKRQLFRLPYCNKEGENRPFVITVIGNGTLIKTDKKDVEWSPSLINDMLVSVGDNEQNKDSEDNEPVEPQAQDNDLWLRFTQEEPDISKAFIYKSTTTQGKAQVVNTVRISPSYCDICDRTHEHDNTLYLLVFNEDAEKMMRGCIRSKETRYVTGGTNTTKKSKDHQLKNAIKKANDPKHCKRLNNPFLVNDNSTIAPVHCFNTTYCADYKPLMGDSTEIIAIRAPMGRGKSYALKLKVKSILQKKPKVKIIINSFRVSLADKYKADYDALGFFCYNTDRAKIIDNDTPRIIIQLDSYGRIRWRGRDNKPDLLVLDEITQVRQHITGKTFLNQQNRCRNWEAFKWCVRTAKQIVMMDANLTSEDIKFINDIRRKKINEPYPSDMNPYVENCNIYCASDKPKNGNAYITTNHITIIRQAHKELKQGKRVYIAHNGSKENIHAVNKYLQGTNPDIKSLVICQDTLHQQKVKDALKDPNAEFAKYSLVMCSPSIQSGISYDRRDNAAFDTVCGIFGNRSNMSADAVQMLHRIRHPTNKNIYVSINNSNETPFLTTADMKHKISINTEHLTDKRDEDALFEMCKGTINDEGAYMITNNDYMRVYLNNQELRARDRKQYIKHFVWYLQHEGHTAKVLKLEEEEKDTAAISRIIRKVLKQVKEGIIADYNKLLGTSINISTDDAKTISKKIENNTHTDEEKATLDKRNLLKHYNMPSDAQPSNEWFDLYNNKSVKKHYTNMRYMSKYDTTAECLQDIKRKEQNNAIYNQKSAEERGDCHTTSKVMDIVSTTTRFKQYVLLFSMLNIIGFSGLHDTIIITKDDLLLGLQTIKDRYLSTAEVHKTVLILNKRVGKIKKITKLATDKGFLKGMLEFINGSIKAQFGVKISSTDHTRTAYTLVNKYTEDQIFTINPIDDKKHIPVLRIEEVEAEEPLQNDDPYEVIEPDKEPTEKEFNEAMIRLLG